VEQAEIGGIVDSLAAEYEQGGAVHHPEILAHLLLALLLRVDRLTDSVDGAAAVPTADSELFARFEDELERSFATTRRAADYAVLLGCSVRTLTRACQDSVGRQVRDVIDARVVLEAKRLLATSDEPLAALGHRLGFSDAAGLGRFFTRHVGSAPGVFRRRYRGDGGGGRRSQRAG
jgi:AraC-like DNA-binding protein